MNTDPEKFNITLEGVTHVVERSMTDKNIYRLRSAGGSYLIARDFYGTWVELTSSPGSPDISLTQAGKQIEGHYQRVSPL